MFTYDVFGSLNLRDLLEAVGTNLQCGCVFCKQDCKFNCTADCNVQHISLHTTLFTAIKSALHCSLLFHQNIPQVNGLNMRKCCLERSNNIMLYYTLCYKGECLPRQADQTLFNSTILQLKDILVPPRDPLELEASFWCLLYHRFLTLNHKPCPWSYSR